MSATADDKTTRRGFAVACGVGLAAADGTFAAVLARFLLPRTAAETRWTLVCRADRVPEAEALQFETPAGASVSVKRRVPGSGDSQFLALSSVCPHLGCQVHWEPQNDRFFCPCHNGVFDPSGVATGGPPAEAGQSLLEYPVKVESGLLYIGLGAGDLESLSARGRAPSCGGCAGDRNCCGRSDSRVLRS